MRSVTVTPADSPIGNGPKDSCRQGGKSRVTGDGQARFRGSRGVRFPPATRLTTHPSSMVAHAGGKLCEHLTGTQARYPGIDLVLRSEAKPTFDPQGLSHYVGSPEASRVRAPPSGKA